MIVRWASKLVSFLFIHNCLCFYCFGGPWFVFLFLCFTLFCLVKPVNRSVDKNESTETEGTTNDRGRV